MAKTSRERKGRGAPALQESVAQLRALAHPLRLRLIELFGEAPRTTMQVAELLGQPPTRLYHHVNALERAGLLQLRETRPKRGTTEKWYQAVAQSFQSAPAASSPHAGERGRQRALTGLGLMVLEQARRELAAALGDPRGERPLAGRLIAADSPARITAIRKRLIEFLRELRREFPSQVPSRGHRRERGASALERWSLRLVFAPTWPRSPGESRVQNS